MSVSDSVSPIVEALLGWVPCGVAPKGCLQGFPEELESPGEGLSDGGAQGPSLRHAKTSLGDVAELGRNFLGAGPSGSVEQA